jgi:hypothetical protein
MAINIKYHDKFGWTITINEYFFTKDNTNLVVDALKQLGFRFNTRKDAIEINSHINIDNFKDMKQIVNVLLEYKAAYATEPLRLAQ